MRLLKIYVVSILLLFVVAPVVNANISDADAQKIAVHNHNYQLGLLKQTSIQSLSHSIDAINRLLHEKIINKSIVSRLLFKFDQLCGSLGISENCSEAVSKQVEQDNDFIMLQGHLMSYYQASNAYQNLELGFSPVLTVDLAKLSEKSSKNILQIIGDTYMSQADKVDLIASSLAVDFSFISSVPYGALKKSISTLLLANKRY